MIEILGKKYIKDIILIIHDKSGSLFFSDLIVELEKIYDTLHNSAISRALTLMVENDLLIREDVVETKRRLPKTKYELTEIGKIAVEIMEKDNEIEKVREAKFSNIINSKNNKEVQIDKFEGELNIK